MSGRIDCLNKPMYNHGMDNESEEANQQAQPHHDTSAVLSWQKEDKERRSRKKPRGTSVHERLGWEKADAEARERRAQHPAGEEGRKGFVDIKLSGTRIKIPGRS